jgi:hypothetical protein
MCRSLDCLVIRMTWYLQRLDAFQIRRAIFVASRSGNDKNVTKRSAPVCLQLEKGHHGTEPVAVATRVFARVPACYRKRFRIRFDLTSWPALFL